MPTLPPERYADVEPGAVAVPKIVYRAVGTLAPCGSPKTLAFMKWLGIGFPRWLEKELQHSGDTLATSVRLAEEIFADLLAFARQKRIPLGVNVESVSIRKAEIDASVELFARLRKLLVAG